VCPRDFTALAQRDGGVVCERGHRYNAVQGVPVLLLDEETPTHPSYVVAPPEPEPVPLRDIDAVVQDVVAATCGNLYRHLIGRLSAYPIPELPLPPREGCSFLEIGCNWGRWCIAASRGGYRATGIDPSLRAVLAAKRVAAQLDADPHYVVGDARRLPFPRDSFDVVFSYSVLQHFAKPDTLRTLAEIARVLKPDGTAMLQFANAWGVRSLVNQLRERRFREPRRLFDVRYWRPRELREELERRIGPTRLIADGFFTLNPQPADLPLLLRRHRAVVHASEALRRLSGRVPLLVNVADSVYAIVQRTP
jgi:SAM-dependent methyltransferase